MQCWSTDVYDWLQLLGRRVRPELRDRFVVFRPTDGGLHPTVPGLGTWH